MSWKKWVGLGSGALVTSVAALAIAGGVVFAQATPDTPNSNTSQDGRTAFGLRGHGPEMGMRGHGPATLGERGEVVAEALGMSMEELQAARDEGMTLSELLDQQELSEEEFQANLKAAVISRIEAAVENGDLTRERADAMIERLENMPADVWGDRRGGPHGRPDGLLDVHGPEIVAEILDMSVDDLQAAHEEGATLEEIIAEQGLTVAEFKSRVVEIVTARINEAVEAGDLTQERADTLLEKLSEWAATDELLAPGPRGDRDGFRGRRGGHDHDPRDGGRSFRPQAPQGEDGAENSVAPLQPATPAASTL